MHINLKEEIEKILEKEWKFFPTLPGDSIDIEDGHQPGVYLIARTNDSEITKRKVKDRLEDIFYVGMSNSLKGVAGRLNQFKNAIEKGKGHSGGNRFFKDGKYCNGVPFSKFEPKSGKKEEFYVVSLTFKCIVSKESRKVEHLEIMGEICCLEYYLLAHIKHNRKDNQEPELNKK
ncbi:MAG: hypothetical protein ABUL44_04070 [Flavobacterium sp.]